MCVCTGGQSLEIVLTARKRDSTSCYLAWQASLNSPFNTIFTVQTVLSGHLSRTTDTHSTLTRTAEWSDRQRNAWFCWWWVTDCLQQAWQHPAPLDPSLEGPRLGGPSPPEEGLSLALLPNLVGCRLVQNLPVVLPPRARHSAHRSRVVPQVARLSELPSRRERLRLVRPNLLAPACRFRVHLAKRMARQQPRLPVVMREQPSQQPHRSEAKQEPNPQLPVLSRC